MPKINAQFAIKNGKSLVASLLASSSLFIVMPASAAGFVKIPNSAISGYNNKHLTGVSVQQCSNACVTETSFSCKSFDYYKNQNACDLSAKSAEDVGGLKYTYSGNPYDHYAKTTDFSRIPKAAISGYNNRHLTNVSVEQCKTACEDESEFICKSFDYYKSQNKCDLSIKSAADVGLKFTYSGNPYDHYARNPELAIPPEPILIPPPAPEVDISCVDWDGTTPQVGDLLRFKNKVVKDKSNGPTIYREDLAGLYLKNVLHGNEPVPKFVGATSGSGNDVETLFHVDASRSTNSGPEIQISSPWEGLATSSDVGFNHAELITDEHSYWSIHTRWIRLANSYRAWTDPNCGSCAATLNDKVPPVAVMQRLAANNTAYSCAQEWSPVYQFVSCDDYYVSIGGYGGETNRELAAQVNDVSVEVCTVTQ